MKISYRPRPVIKRYAESLDRDEIGLVYDRDCNEFYVCPPDLSSDVENELVDHWMVFLQFTSLVPSFQFDRPTALTSVQQSALIRAIKLYLDTSNKVHVDALLKLEHDLIASPAKW